jgi:hypothetical protein
LKSFVVPVCRRARARQQSSGGARYGARSGVSRWLTNSVAVVLELDATPEVHSELVAPRRGRNSLKLLIFVGGEPR